MRKLKKFTFWKGQERKAVNGKSSLFLEVTPHDIRKNEDLNYAMAEARILALPSSGLSDRESNPITGLERL